MAAELPGKIGRYEIRQELGRGMMGIVYLADDPVLGRPNVRLQVIPFHVGGHAAGSGAFSILRFPDQDLPDVVYVEQLTSALYLDKRDDIDEYVLSMERLCVEADPPARTADTLRRILKDNE